MGFLTAKLQTSDKGEKFLEGTHIGTIEKLIIYEAQDGVDYGDLVIVEVKVTESDNPETGIGTVYAQRKEINTKFGVELVHQVLSAAEGLPRGDQRYKGTTVIKTETYDKKLKKVVEGEEEVSNLNLRLSELFDTDAELEENGLTRLDVIGKRVKVVCEAGVSKKGKPYVDAKFLPVKRASGAAQGSDEDEDLFPGE